MAGFGGKEKRGIYYDSLKKILFQTHYISRILLVKQSSHSGKAHRYVNKPARYHGISSEDAYRVPWSPQNTA